MNAELKRRHPVQQIISTLLTAETADKTARSIKYQMTGAKLPTAKELADFILLFETVGRSQIFQPAVFAEVCV